MNTIKKLRDFVSTAVDTSNDNELVISLTEEEISSLLIDGYIRKCNKKWITPHSVIKLIKSYYPQKYKIYAIGDNKCGEFGIGNDLPTSQYVELSDLMSICDDCNDIYVSKSRIIVRNIKNELYSSGNNHFGACCQLRKSSNLTQFCQIEDAQTEFISLISTGVASYHTVLMNDKCEFYGFGINDNGQFGDGYRNDNGTYSMIKLQNVTRIFSNTHPVILIKSGMNHTLFLTKQRRVWSCGKNNFGQCGIKRRMTGRVLTASLVPVLQNIVDMDCGLMHNLCLDGNSKIWCFGYNRFGQLGYDGNKVCDEPMMNSFFANKNIDFIDCGKYHSLCIEKEKDRQCWLFGRNHERQIGVSHTQHTTVKRPHLFQSQRGFENVKIVNGSCGYWHTVLLTNNNQIYTFGQCQSSETRSEPKIILIPQIELGIDKNQKIIKVFAGDNTTIVCTQ